MDDGLREWRDARLALQRVDGRTPAERDRDRVLYAPAFRRLAGVTQVVGIGETQLFHNRLTHSLKVAQVARRMAEYLARRDPAAADAAGGIDPDCVEVAALAHDLGHPPFGHVAEQKLQELLADAAFSGLDSFEGNAQSFRIITKLSVRTYLGDERGLNLTRATLRACSKYPWLQGDSPDEHKAKKWGAYRSESQELQFALDGAHSGGTSVEAQLMDWADDIAYAVHDLEDFFRVGRIPLDRIATQADASREFVSIATARLEGKGLDAALCRAAFDDVGGLRLSGLLPVEPYSGSLRDQALLQTLGSALISRYVNAVNLGEDGFLVIDRRLEHELAMLKQLTWHFVIDDPSLATAQRGQCAVIEGLFNELISAAGSAKRLSDRLRLPTQLREFLNLARNDRDTVGAVGGDDRLLIARAVVDYIASLTEHQAVSLYQRLTGATPVSALDAWIRL